MVLHFEWLRHLVAGSIVDFFNHKAVGSQKVARPQKSPCFWGTFVYLFVPPMVFFHVFFVLLCRCNSLKLLGGVELFIAKRGTRFEALEPLRQGIVDHFGALAKKAAEGLTIRHDHGSQFISNTYQKELRFLGIKSSPSFVREPQGNGIAERFSAPLKKISFGSGASTSSRNYSWLC